MHSNAFVTVAMALLVSLSSAAGSAVGTANMEVKRADFTPCPTCHLSRRDDGTIAVVDRAVHETIGRAVFYDEAVAEMSKRDTSFLIKPETRMFAKRDGCERYTCNNGRDCLNHSQGCENGCNTNGRCHPVTPKMCTRCEINKRSDGYIEIRDADTGALVGHAE